MLAELVLRRPRRLPIPRARILPRSRIAVRADRGTWRPLRLVRAQSNPLLRPIAAHDWESDAVFNAAAIEIVGRVHLLYRAIGRDGASVFGHASSTDGTNIDQRDAEPVYRGLDRTDVDAGVAAAAAMHYRSGPGDHGCEDPRLTRIDETIYMTYTAFDGLHAPAVALTAIDADDFAAGRWRWRPPVRISAPDEAHKNWVLFPERIGGRYAILHGLWPSVRIAYRDDLAFAGGCRIASRFVAGGPAGLWDNRMRGAGPPPIATAAGWLLLYHAMDRRDPDRYKLGAMLLDRADPTRVLARLPYPLLAPDAACENEGHKHGVVYACGAVVRDDVLSVYYGGADTVLCAAQMPLADLLARLRAAA